MVAGQGLEGDRYYAGRGAWSHYPDQTGSDLALIEAEALEAVGLSGTQARRNLVTRGVRLNKLVDPTFQIGETDCRGIRLCEPCEHLARMTGVPVSALLHRAASAPTSSATARSPSENPITAIQATPRDLGALSDADFRQVLEHCRFHTGGLRAGFVPFNAPCVAVLLASRNGLDPKAVAAGLERWAQSLGGEVSEGEVLWLPTNQFDTL